MQRNLFFFKESFSETEGREKHAWFALVRFVLSFLLCTICASTDCAGCENAGEWAESCLIVILQYPPQGISWLWHSCYTQGHFYTHLKLTLLLRWCTGSWCTVKTTSVLVTLCGGYCWALQAPSLSQKKCKALHLQSTLPLALCQISGGQNNSFQTVEREKFKAEMKSLRKRSNY